jgi:lipopolysaccharide/colanic/teichoic acid biosynthesis glycosyltransferase
MRRLIDLVVAGALLTLAAPLMLLVALAIRVESPGPILVRENCIGRPGRRFQGEVLRFTRIETLPQLINVIRGEMSIVDPDGRSPSFLD